MYEELDSSPLSELEAEVSNVVSEIQVCEHALSDKEAEYLQVRGSKLGRFYLLPKIHKGLSDVVGRPVISNCGTATEHISEYLDFHLNPLVSKSKSFVKDTNHFLSLLAKLGEIPDNALLCTADVVGLYPNIPHGEGLEAMRKALDTRQNPSISTKSLVSLGKLVLDSNVFEFNGKVYKQKLGTAIGTKFAPAYANLFMSSLEEDMLNSCEVKPWIWYRYIDDVFFIWTHGEEKLCSFVEYINSYHQTIKFTTEKSRDSVSYLDVLVSRKGRALETDLYCKSTDTHQYLQRSSCHPWHVKKAIPYGQALRIRRICSDEKKFRKRSEELVSWLVDRGYKEDFVREQIVRASSLDRERLFNQEGRCNDKRKDQVPLVVTFHPALNELRGIIRKLHTMLEASEEHRMAFKEQPLVVFRRAPNLKDNLVRAKLPKIRTEGVRGCFRCGKARCQVCSYMSEGSGFRCNVSGREYDINSDFNCDSSGVVYLLGCKVCGKQYVGSTFTSFRARFNNYKSSSRKFSSGVAVTQAELFRHFTEANHHGFLEDVSFQIIDRVFGVSRHKEGFWQFRLQSFIPEGLNVRYADH